MHERKSRLDELGGSAIFVAFDEPGKIREQMLHGVDLRFPFAVDPALDAYGGWGLHRAPWWKIWLDPAVWKQYARLLASGERVRGSGADPYQLGGDFVVGADGRIVYSRPQERDDRPPVGELLEAVRRGR
ncbi:MAG: AhpC/TSA family protein [Longimicrobiales bacterium]|nr:AhpC/TSA family protein [Longimicrobiales bacterium]